MREEELASRLRGVEVADPAGCLPLGTCLGEWRLTAFVARGGSADVYCAEHVALGTSAAVKVLRDEGTDSRRERFRREAKILAELHSVSFPRFFAYGASDGHDYLVEELLEPRELPIGTRTITRFLLTLCSAVGELHARGLVHCDIKPANILFRPGSDEPVLVDLGLAASAAEGASDGGTPGYSAPEQFLGGEITPSADIHALGVLAERLGLKWKGVIRHATSSIPSERFKTVGEFSRAIRGRLWCRCVCQALLTAVGVGSVVVIAVFLSSLVVPDEIRLEGQKVVRSFPLRVPSGKTLRVIGPGTLDATITGAADSCLWMTNCIVINRSATIFPEVPLRYELTCGVYLNFINADWPYGQGGRGNRDAPTCDGAYNDIRYRGPETAAELMRLRRRELEAKPEYEPQGSRRWR